MSCHVLRLDLYLRVTFLNTIKKPLETSLLLKNPWHEKWGTHCYISLGTWLMAINKTKVWGNGGLNFSPLQSKIYRHHLCGGKSLPLTANLAKLVWAKSLRVFKHVLGSIWRLTKHYLCYQFKKCAMLRKLREQIRVSSTQQQQQQLKLRSWEEKMTISKTEIVLHEVTINYAQRLLTTTSRS